MSGSRFTLCVAATAAALLLGGCASAPTPDRGSSPPLGRLTAIPGTPTTVPVSSDWAGWPVLDPAAPGGPVTPGTAATSAPAVARVAEPLAKKTVKKKAKAVKKKTKKTAKAPTVTASAPAASGTSYAARVRALATTYGCPTSTPITIDRPVGSQGAFDGIGIHVAPGLSASRLPYVVAHECAHVRSINVVYGYDWSAAAAAANSVFGGSGDLDGLDRLADCMSLAEGTTGQHYTSSCSGARGAAARAVLAGHRI